MQQPDWLDTDEYPFEPQFIEVEGGNLHYVDEGEGRPIVFLHGNPSWSFLFRFLIKGLSSRYRCIAPDYIGFGLSDKPEDFSYLPEAHARNFTALMEHLDLHDVTLVLHDWGGPIGIDYAVNHPDRIHSFVIMNTWFWPVPDDSYYRFYSGFVGGPIGRVLVRKLNFITRNLMRQLSADTSKLPQHIHLQYIYPQKYNCRKGNWIFPREVIGSTTWLEGLWDNVYRVTDKPTQIIWGLKDTAFKRKELRVIQKQFTNIYETIEFDKVGHYVPEEVEEDLVPYLEDFFAELEGLSVHG